MPLVRRTLALWALLAFATVSPAFADKHRRHGPPASPGPPGPTAPAVDCGPDSFTESASMTPLNFNGVSCVDGSDFHFANSWFRSFHLPDYGLQGQFFVCQVNLAIEYANTPGHVGQPMTVNLYTNSGCPFPNGTLTPIGSAGVTVADQALTPLTVLVNGTAPAGSDLVVEIAVPDGTGAQAEFFLGSNSAGQTGPSYLQDPECGDLTPVDLASVGFPDTHVILQVVGTEDIIAPTADTVDGAGDGVVTLGEQVTVAPTWKNINTAACHALRDRLQPGGPGRPDLHAGRRHGGIRPHRRGRQRQLRGRHGRLLRRQDRRGGVRAPRRDLRRDAPVRRGAGRAAGRQPAPDPPAPRRSELRGRRSRQQLLPVHRDAAPQQRHERMRHGRLVLPDQHDTAQTDGRLPPEGAARILLRPAARRRPLHGRPDQRPLRAAGSRISPTATSRPAAARASIAPTHSSSASRCRSFF